jgi:hypothetical protein
VRVVSISRLQAQLLIVTMLSLATARTADAQCQNVPGNVVLYCGFESGPQASGAYYPNASVAGWTSSDGTRERWVGGFGGFHAREGIGHVELNVNAPTSLWQYISTTAGATYDLSFSAAHRVNPNVRNSFSQIDVFIDNTFLFTTGPITQGFRWQDYATTFVASGASAKLEFRGTGNGASYGNHLDNVVASVSSVPEPTTYLLVGSALAAVALAARRRR